MTVPVLRFAPSPNGRLHLGHAYSALLNHDTARSRGGRFLLRMEDIDTTRCTTDLEAGVLKDLAWLGLDWEHPVRRQSEHFADYAPPLARLEEMGLVYRAYLTRKEIRDAVARAEARTGRPWPRDPDGAPLYPGDAAVLTPDQIARRAVDNAPHALRLDMTRALAKIAQPLDWIEEGGGTRDRIAAEPARWGDVVLARKEIPTSYHLSVVVDDAAQGITHVMRGRDLYAATAVHRLLQVLLDLPAPVYHHHPLILDAQGRKLSKSDGDTALAALRSDGWTPEDVRARVGL